MLPRVSRCAEHPEALTSMACAVCGRPVCAACDAGNRHASRCPEHESVRLVQGWAEVLQTVDDAEAELFTGRLRALGLDAHVLSQKDHVHVLSVGALAVVRVLVPAWQWDRARAALAESGEGRPAGGAASSEIAGEA